MTATTATPARAKLGTPIPETGKTIFYGFARLCNLEERLGGTIGDIMDRVANVDVRTIRECVRQGLEHHHKDVTRDDVDDVLNDAGVAAAAQAVVQEINLTIAGRSARTDS